jgi:hypothetical protein
MKPLINQFTKNLSGCSGCGSNLANPIWFKDKQEGEMITYVIPVKIQAATVKEAIAKLDGVDGEIMAVNQAPQQQQTVTSSTQGSGQFSRTTTQPTPK